MKPIQVAVLVVAAAVAGGLITKWQTSRNEAPVSAVAVPAAVPAAAAPAPAAPAEQAEPMPAHGPEQAHPSPFPAEKPVRDSTSVEINSNGVNVSTKHGHSGTDVKVGGDSSHVIIKTK